MGWASLIPTVLKIIMHIVKYFTSKRYRNQKKNEKRQQERKKLKNAVNKGDTGEVNKRVRKILKVLPVAFIISVGGCVSTGGDEQVMYIAEEQKVIRMEHNGETGWWVPDAVMFKLVDEAESNEKKQRGE